MSEIVVSAFSWVPDFARGLVRDLRVRWALEEAGIAYRSRLLDARGERPADYLSEQPFGQVPAFRDGSVSMFESGAIVLHIAGGSSALMPPDAQGRARASSWVFAALNSVEPAIQQLAAIDLFHPDEDWAQAMRPEAVDEVRGRLGRLEAHLASRQWLEGRFTAGDLLMVSVLRILRHTDLVSGFPALADYQARGEARPAFARALAAQLNDFQAGAAATA